MRVEQLPPCVDYVAWETQQNKPAQLRKLEPEPPQSETEQEPAGEGGFTYDYVFFEEKSGCTLAEMPTYAVDRLSHRAKAVREIKNDLLRLLKED